MVFVKTNMTRDVNLVCGWIKTPIPMKRGAILKKDTRGGAKIHLMTYVGYKAEDAESIDTRKSLKKEKSEGREKMDSKDEVLEVVRDGIRLIR